MYAGPGTKQSQDGHKGAPGQNRKENPRVYKQAAVHGILGYNTAARGNPSVFTATHGAWLVYSRRE